MKRISEKFLTGAMYAPFCRTAHAPMEEWKQDMANMARLGYTCLHGFAEWHDIEYEKGRFDFTKMGGFDSWEDWCEYMEQNLADHIHHADCIFKEEGENF